MSNISKAAQRADDPPSLCVLMYHGIHEGPDTATHFDPIYSVDRGDFEYQLDTVRAAGLKTTSLAETGRGPADVLITFDDGDESNLTVAAPLLHERRMVAEFFISTRFLGEPGMLSPGQVRQLGDLGMGINSHGHTHRYLSELPLRELRDELVRSKETLEELTGRNVVGLALPGGRGGTREIELAREVGYLRVLNSVPRANRLPPADRCLGRFAVRRRCSRSTFVGLVTGTGRARRVELARYAALSVPRRLLGDELYRAVRSRAVSLAAR